MPPDSNPPSRRFHDPFTDAAGPGDGRQAPPRKVVLTRHDGAARADRSASLNLPHRERARPWMESFFSSKNRPSLAMPDVITRTSRMDHDRPGPERVRP